MKEFLEHSEGTFQNSGTFERTFQMFEKNTLEHLEHLEILEHLECSRSSGMFGKASGSELLEILEQNFEKRMFSNIQNILDV